MGYFWDIFGIIFWIFMDFPDSTRTRRNARRKTLTQKKSMLGVTPMIVSESRANARTSVRGPCNNPSPRLGDCLVQDAAFWYANISAVVLNRGVGNGRHSNVDALSPGLTSFVLEKTISCSGRPSWNRSTPWALEHETVASTDRTLCFLSRLQPTLN